jgi:hypothetical protein
MTLNATPRAVGLLLPKTGEAVHRIISGGYGVPVRGGLTGPSVGSCGTHRIDLDSRTSEVATSLVSRPCFTLFAASDSDNAVR